MSFDFWALLLIFFLSFGFLLIITKITKRYQAPKILFSNATLLKRTESSWKLNLKQLPSWLMGGALCCWLIAFSDPHIFLAKPELKLGKMALYLVLDHSGSMKEKVNTINPDGKPSEEEKFKFLQLITNAFILGNPQYHLNGHPQDLIGVVTFARSAEILSPLTLNHKAIADKIAALDVVKNKDDDGTAIGYALYKTANTIYATRNYAKRNIGKDRPALSMENAIIILITDGFHDPSILDANNPIRNIDPIEAAKDAKKKGVRIYIINIDPTLATLEFAPERHLMEETAEITGGKYFGMTGTENLSQIFGEIEQIESKYLSEQDKEGMNQQIQGMYHRYSFYWFFIGLGMLLLALSLILSATLFRSVP